MYSSLQLFLLTQALWGCCAHFGLNQFSSDFIFKISCKATWSRDEYLYKSSTLMLASGQRVSDLRNGTNSLHFLRKLKECSQNATVEMIKVFSADLFKDLYRWCVSRQPIGIEPSYSECLVPWEPPLFLHPVCRMNRNMSPCVPLKQLHARPHEGNTIGSVCQYHPRVCRQLSSSVYQPTLLTKCTVAEWQAGVTIPNYRWPLIAGGVIRNEAAGATVTRLWRRGEMLLLLLLLKRKRFILPFYAKCNSI